MFAPSYFVFVCKVKSWLHYPTYYRTFYQTYLVFLLPWLWKRIPMLPKLPLWSSVSSKTKAVFVWQLVPSYEICHNFQFRICVPISKKEYESYDIQTDDIIGQSRDYFIPRPTPSGPPYRKDFLLRLLFQCIVIPLKCDPL